MKMHKLLERINAGRYTEREMTELPCQGESPWGGQDNPEGVWAWSQDDNEVIVGEDALSIVSYQEAHRIYGF